MKVHNFRKRKPTGGRYKDVKPKRLAQEGREPTHTKIGDRKVQTKRVRGGNVKGALVTDKFVNVTDDKGKAVKAEITNVTGNDASRHFVRRNIITKGAILDTSKGKVKVTNRPGQEGVINGVLVKE